MKLINKQQISHIKVYDGKPKVWFKYGGWVTMKFIPYRKHKWWEEGEETKEGYYQGGRKSSFGQFITAEQIKKEKGLKIVGDLVHTLPHIEIFSSDCLVHTEYFTTFAELEKHLENNYKDFDLRYES